MLLGEAREVEVLAGGEALVDRQGDAEPAQDGHVARTMRPDRRRVVPGGEARDPRPVVGEVEDVHGVELHRVARAGSGR